MASLMVSIIDSIVYFLLLMLDESNLESALNIESSQYC